MLYVCSYFTLKDMHNSQSLRRILFIGNGGGEGGDVHLAATHSMNSTWNMLLARRNLL